MWFLREAMRGIDSPGSDSILNHAQQGNRRTIRGLPMTDVLPLMDRMIHTHRKAVRLYLGCFFGALALGVTLFVLTLIISSTFNGTIAKIASGFVMLLAAPPLTLVLKRKDRITALKLMKQTIARTSPDSPDASKVEAIVWSTLQKMAAG